MRQWKTYTFESIRRITVTSLQGSLKVRSNGDIVLVQVRLEAQSQKISLNHAGRPTLPSQKIMFSGIWGRQGVNALFSNFAGLYD
ncbi:hypothetical protein ElyMa_004990000 [Elysia marginata]|uniref:Uncharacterized protein n=1 Tax=Elysia marginata TaxID=1093978 RepID=A0AAV4J5T7_9GAST|nr:hypothetical protein ElyMa_004990000 [Elysia marginata]